MNGDRKSMTKADAELLMGLYYRETRYSKRWRIIASILWFAMICFVLGMGTFLTIYEQPGSVAMAYFFAFCGFIFSIFFIKVIFGANSDKNNVTLSNNLLGELKECLSKETFERIKRLAESSHDALRNRDILTLSKLCDEEYQKILDAEQKKREELNRTKQQEILNK